MRTTQLLTIRSLREAKRAFALIESPVAIAERLSATNFSKLSGGRATNLTGGGKSWKKLPVTALPNWLWCAPSVSELPYYP